MKNKVSLWVGNFLSKSELEDYVSLIYSLDSDFPLSKFKTDFGIDYYDDDFQEIYRNIEEVDYVTLIKPISYSETFIEQIPKKVEKGNSIIAIYNFIYDGSINKVDNVLFLGTFDYSY